MWFRCSELGALGTASKHLLRQVACRHHRVAASHADIVKTYSMQALNQWLWTQRMQSWWCRMGCWSQRFSCGSTGIHQHELVGWKRSVDVRGQRAEWGRLVGLSGGHSKAPGTSICSQGLQGRLWSSVLKGSLFGGTAPFIGNNVTVVQVTKCFFSKSCTSLKRCKTSINMQKEIKGCHQTNTSRYLFAKVLICIFFNLHLASWTVHDRTMTASKCRCELEAWNTPRTDCKLPKRLCRCSGMRCDRIQHMSG